MDIKHIQNFVKSDISVRTGSNTAETIIFFLVFDPSVNNNNRISVFFFILLCTLKYNVAVAFNIYLLGHFKAYTLVWQHRTSFY